MPGKKSYSGRRHCTACTASAENIGCFTYSKDGTGKVETNVNLATPTSSKPECGNNENKVRTRELVKSEHSLYGSSTLVNKILWYGQLQRASYKEIQNVTKQIMKRNQLCGCLHYRPVMGRAAEHVQMSSTRVLPGSHFERPLSEFQVLPDCGRKISLDESRRARTARGLERSSDAEHTGRPTARQTGRQAARQAGRREGRPAKLALCPSPLVH